jgi:biopolymer transport protein ExbD
MARPKIARKSTVIDMTAMCDVAFLLLSFFILTTKFKPAEAVEITTPNSVSSKVAPDKDIVLISITKDGKAFLSMDDESKKEQVLTSLNNLNSLGLSGGEIKALSKSPFWGVPLNMLKQQATIPADQLKGDALPGIPVQDSTNNQMINWMRSVTEVYAGTNINLLMKGDNATKYPAFKNVVTAFKRNELFKFQMVTNPESVPSGTDLWKQNMAGQKQGE